MMKTFGQLAEEPLEVLNEVEYYLGFVPRYLYYLEFWYAQTLTTTGPCNFVSYFVLIQSHFVPSALTRINCDDVACCSSGS